MKKKFSSMWRVALALVLVLSFNLVMATPVSASATVTAASGGGAISADDTGGAWTTLGAITISEGASADIAAGTFVLTIPSGFVFDIGSVPDVAVTGTTPQLAADSPAVITPTTITVTVTAASTSETDNDLIIGGTTPIQVRPTAGTPLATGDITMTSGTIAGVNGSTNFGTLTEVHGAVDHFLVVTENGDEEVAGTAFLVDITAQDQFDNLAESYTGAKDIDFTSTATDAPDGTAATIPDTESITFGTGAGSSAGAGFTLVNVSETPTITATDASAITGTSASILVEGINLDSEGYRTGGTATVTVGDASKNTQPTVAETTSIRAMSATTNPDTIFIALTETGVDTGIFAGTFDLVNTTPGPGELLVTHGDAITITYSTDTTLEVPPLNEAEVDDVDPVFALVDPVVSDADFYRNTDEITLTADVGETGLTVTADFSGIDSEYTTGDEAVVDEGDNTYTVTYTIAEANTMTDGEYTISMTAEDVAGNSVTDTSFSTTLDNTAPSVTDPTADPAVIQPSVATDVTFSASVSDDGSEVATVTVDLSSITGSATQALLDDGTQGDAEAGDGIYTYRWAALSFAVEDTYTLTITATDVVGNVNDTVDITLRVIADIDDPVIVSTAVEYPLGYESARPTEPVVITAVVTDVLSGVQMVTVDATEIGLGAAEVMSLVEGTTDTYSSAELTVDSEVVPGTYTLTITATDYAANEDTADVTVEVTAVLTAFNIDLYEGWNLVSLPLIPDVAAIETVLTGVTVDIVWAYDASIADPLQRWSSYIPGVSIDLSEMVDGKAYWVEMSAEATLTIHGKELPDPPQTPPVYSVVEGWNFIGFKSTIMKPAENYLLAIETQYTVIYSFNPVNQTYVTVAPGGDFVPGKGYWIAVTEAGNIYP